MRHITTPSSRLGARLFTLFTLFALGLGLTLSGCHHHRSRGQRHGVHQGGGDGNRGHGNDRDGHDEDNPGRGRGPRR